MHDNPIVNVSSIIPNTQIVFDEMIKGVHIKIGKYLAGQVPDRQAATRRAVEKALGRRQIIPVAFPSFDYTVGGAIIEDDLFT